MSKPSDDYDVTIRIRVDSAEAMDDALADILCWSRGFMAACPDRDVHPIGLEQLRDLRGRLRTAIRSAREARR